MSETVNKVLEKWRDAAEKWEVRRINKQWTAWEACGLSLWVALNSSAAENRELKQELDGWIQRHHDLSMQFGEAMDKIEELQGTLRV